MPDADLGLRRSRSVDEGDPPPVARRVGTHDGHRSLGRSRGRFRRGAVDLPGSPLAERLGDDLGVGKNGGGAGDLDLVARNGNACEGGRSNERRESELKRFHLGSPEEDVCVKRAFRALCR